MTIYALKADIESAQNCNVNILESLKNGTGVFGWSYDKSSNLLELEKKIEVEGWDALSVDQKNCYQGFLLDLKPGDYVVYINLPAFGQCTLAQVTATYSFDGQKDDFNHQFGIDPQSIRQFDRNASFVPPDLSARLKLQSRWWTIYCEDEFYGLVKTLQDSNLSEEELSKKFPQDIFFKNGLEQPLKEISKVIQKNHPNYKLEHLMERAFKNVPRVMNVKRQGGAFDHGADLLISYKAGPPVPGLETDETMAVQVKSYEYEMSSLQAIEDLKRAKEMYEEAGSFLIVTTAETISDGVKNEIEKFKKEYGNITILFGAELARFILRHIDDSDRYKC